MRLPPRGEPTPPDADALPFLNVGFVPVLQIVVLPPVVFWIAARRLRLERGHRGGATNR